MVIDTSAILAILGDEPEREALIQKIESAKVRLIAAPTLLEGEILLHARKGPLGRAELELFIYEAEFTVVPFDKAQVHFAFLAWEQYGQGQHPANLNWGDCMAYALAKSRSEPLLFQKAGFTQTDIQGW
ncbi:type II toxin-antitoxin system VapC family toxin [Spirulina sp. CS-785/01]|uniref:type II toxin-antitoxin system VapC family toxin n=1 Tax=Spirulina sp. CS-785/01 TaxID=3021716 RepID=UPI0023305B71|nr:type II toxin-antitoxin system VapC family toxin [Spirulina sp. CS-785/01]MDB9312981.1 type II toxin-antitoxin system VapC family toxin [Spirulina sp. CS-785/01]